MNKPAFIWDNKPTKYTQIDVDNQGLDYVDLLMPLVRYNQVMEDGGCYQINIV